MVIQAQVGLRLKTERVMNEWRRAFTLLRCGEPQSRSIGSGTLPPATVVLTMAATRWFESKLRVTSRVDA